MVVQIHTTGPRLTVFDSYEDIVPKSAYYSVIQSVSRILEKSIYTIKRWC